MEIHPHPRLHHDHHLAHHHHFSDLDVTVRRWPVTGGTRRVNNHPFLYHHDDDDYDGDFEGNNDDYHNLTI